jgi:hypothetical protein
MGAILVPGRRTIASALRVMGLDQVPHFTSYHRVLNRNRWSGRWLSCRLFGLLVATFVPSGEPVVIVLDDTIERRWGLRIKKRGIYRDPVRSSHGHIDDLAPLSLGMFVPRSPSREDVSTERRDSRTRSAIGQGLLPAIRCMDDARTA